MPKMKTTTSTAHGAFHITILGENIYRLTHQTRPTQTVTGETELLAEIATDDDGDVEVRIVTMHDNATIALSRDTRHGVTGWRGSRYEEIGKPSKHWDECYLFFETLHGAIEAFCKTGPAAETAIREARRRF